MSFVCLFGCILPLSISNPVPLDDLCIPLEWALLPSSFWLCSANTKPAEAIREKEIEVGISSPKSLLQSLLLTMFFHKCPNSCQMTFYRAVSLGSKHTAHCSFLSKSLQLVAPKISSPRQVLQHFLFFLNTELFI